MQWILFLALFVDQPKPYEEAYVEATQSNKPLLVLVTASWCGPCQIMKKEFEYDGVVSAIVDVDKQPDIAKQIMKGDKVPQLVLFKRKGNAWQRLRLIGRQTRERVIDFIKGK